MEKTKNIEQEVKLEDEELRKKLDLDQMRNLKDLKTTIEKKVDNNYNI